MVTMTLVLLGRPPAGYANPVMERAQAERPAFMDSWQELVEIDSGTGDE